MANFKKLAQEAKKFHQNFTGTMESSEGTFKFTYRMLNGLDGTWVFRGNFSNESATSQNLLLDHRSACASLISLEDEDGEVLNPVEIVKVLFSEEELNNVENVLEKFEDNDLERISNKLLWDASKNVKTVEEFLTLGLPNKEIIWELLHLGFRTTFDADFNLQFGFTWANAYKALKPNIAMITLQNQLKKIQENVNEETSGS
jgi:hypothetical protein